MKFPSGDRRGGSDDQLIPLINVVFLMLIFFMVIGRIGPADRLQVTPPASRSQLPASEQGVTILIARDGSLAIDETPVALATLVPRLQAALDRAELKWGSPAELRIKADAALTAGQLAPLLSQLRESGRTKVRLLTWPGK
ncbi:MAG: biopolymer transporter ExbD [Gammaproteobacteria bacterium]|nr:biopolymer transporter ExbD [Gammaproteobacteria bacterium]